MRRCDVAVTVDSIKKAICAFESVADSSENEIFVDSSSDSESSPKRVQRTVQKRNLSSVYSYGKRKRKKSAKAKLNFTKIELNDSKTVWDENCRKAYTNSDSEILHISSKNAKKLSMDVSNDKYSKLCQSENNTDPNVSPILTSRHVFKINHKFSKVNIAEANIRVKPIENCDGESLINSATVENKLDRSPVLKSNYYTKKKISYEEPKIGKTKDVQNQNFKSLERITSDDVCISSYDSQVSPLNVISQESRISSLQISPEENHVSLKSDLCDNSEINNMSSKEITFNNCTKTNTVESVSKKKKKFPLTSNAGRLQKLLRKQDSMISIWKHEKYMASRGNFECPVAPEKSLILKIIGCREECGMFLIDCEDCVENTKYIAIINSYFVKEVTVSCNWTLTIYKPYKIIQINSNENTANVDKVIVNVCKFDVTKV